MEECPHNDIAPLSAEERAKMQAALLMGQTALSSTVPGLISISLVTGEMGLRLLATCAALEAALREIARQRADTPSSEGYEFWRGVDHCVRIALRALDAAR